jgi:hypothetical protein
MVKLVLKEKKNLKEAVQINTYGELRNAIKTIINKERASAGSKEFIQGVIGQIPGIGMSKTAYDVVKAIYSATDDKKTNTFLDKINVDDKFSQIVDDKVEMMFLKVLAMMIEGKPENESIANFNVNQELVDYLQNNYEKRTLTFKK